MRTLLLLALALPNNAAYQYAVTDQYSSQAGSWTTNGTLQWYVHGLSGIGSRILYYPAVGSEHEVRTVLNPSCSTTYFHYLRATQDANILTPAGTFYAVELQPTCSPGQPTTVRMYKRHSGTLTLLAQGSAALNSGDVVRSLYRNGAIHAYINADFYLSAADTAISSGQPGVGSNQYTAGGMTIIQLGAADTVAPSAPDAQKVSISTRPTQIDLQSARPTTRTALVFAPTASIATECKSSPPAPPNSPTPLSLPLLPITTGSRPSTGTATSPPLLPSPSPPPRPIMSIPSASASTPSGPTGAPPANKSTSAAVTSTSPSP